MKTRLMTILLTGLTLAVLPAIAADVDVPSRLDAALKQAASFEYGQDSGPLRLVEQLVVEAATNRTLRLAVEDRLLQALDMPATRDAREFYCRQLFIVGTARSVPKLEPMLLSPEIAHMARYVLGRLEGPEAPAALLRTLPKTTGKLQAGILNTLGERRYAPAVTEVAKLQKSPDPLVAQAAIAALGKIGSPAAAKALQSARPDARPALQTAIDQALLACADALLASGQKNDAAQIYTSLDNALRPAVVRVAALRGILEARGAAATDRLVGAIRGEDTALAGNAIAFSRSVKGAEITAALAKLLPTLASETQALLCVALGDRGDRLALPAVTALATNTNAAVRAAALGALGRIGDASSMDLLARTAAEGGSVQRVARASLVQLSGADINPAILTRVSSSPPKVRVELIRALSGRKAHEAVNDLLRLAQEEDAAVRREAITALGVLVDGKDLAQLVGLAVNPREPGDRGAVEEAIETAFRRVPDAATRAGILLAAMPGAAPEAKATLLGLLKLAPTPAALEAVRTAMTDAAEPVRVAAARCLCDWPDAAPAEDLLTLAQTGSSQTIKVLALRGYVRMAGLTANPAARYARAMELAARPEDKKLVLAGLGTADSLAALQLAQKHLADESLQAEAGSAIAQIASRLRRTDAAAAREAVKQVVATAKDERVRQQAREVLNELERYEGFILKWQVTGVYKEKGKESRALFDAVFPPESSGATDVAWKPLKEGVGAWDIVLDNSLGSDDHCAAYVRTRVWSPADQDARLELGSDDAIKAWLNGALVHAHYAQRGVTPGGDVVKVRLRLGWNDLLLKIVDHEGGWAFCCRLRGPDGGALDGLKVETP